MIVYESTSLIKGAESLEPRTFFFPNQLHCFMFIVEYFWWNWNTNV